MFGIVAGQAVSRSGWRCLQELRRLLGLPERVALAVT